MATNRIARSTKDTKRTKRFSYASSRPLLRLPAFVSLVSFVDSAYLTGALGGDRSCLVNSLFS